MKMKVKLLFIIIIITLIQCDKPKKEQLIILPLVQSNPTTTVTVEKSRPEIAYDSATNLMWQRCAIGQKWNPNALNCTGNGNSANNYGIQTFHYCKTFGLDHCNDTTYEYYASPNYTVGGRAIKTYDGSGEIFDVCDNLVLSGRSDWRVPTHQELRTLVHCINNAVSANGMCDPTKPQYPIPTIDNIAFPNTVNNGYYYASADSMQSSTNDFFWSVSFSNGASPGGRKATDLHYVRCVADGLK